MYSRILHLTTQLAFKNIYYYLNDIDITDLYILIIFPDKMFITFASKL